MAKRDWDEKTARMHRFFGELQEKERMKQRARCNPEAIAKSAAEVRKLFRR